MFDCFNKLAGSALLTVRGADPAQLLDLCIEAGIPVLSAQSLDEVTLRVRVPDRALGRFCAAAGRCQCEIGACREEGAGAAGRALRRRLLPALCLAAFLFVLLWSKLYLWEIQVTGNETVSTGRILTALADCGVEIGSYWPSLTSDAVRSEMLVRLPELAWMTVNVRGSRAKVLVRERIPKPEMIAEGEAADLRASHDGFILTIRALRGREVVRRGQAVSRGELLVSGTMQDRDGDTRTVHAYGSVRARTYYEFSALIPLAQEEKRYTGQHKDRWSLRIGEKTIKFYKNSSIYETDCDTIYSTYKLEIKGLFSLPLTLVRERRCFYEREMETPDGRARCLETQQRLHEGLLASLRDGEILSERFSVSATEGGLTVCLRAECEEDIGVSVPLGEELAWRGSVYP